jgi:hypothetical protein
MKRRLGWTTFFLATAVAAPLLATTVKQHVEVLAADDMEGRMTGMPGADKAVAYLVQQLQEMGVQPLPGSGGLKQEFEFTAGSKDAGTVLRLVDADGEAHTIQDNTKVQALSFSDATSVSGEVVFAGYGLKLPDDSEFPYDSYASIDVKDKIAVVMRYFPEDVDRDTRALLARYSGLRYKALQAREAGAKALVLITGPKSPNAGEVVPMRFDTALSGSGIAAVSIDGEIAQSLVAGTGKTLEEIQESFDTGNPHVTGFTLEGVTLDLDVKIERKRSTGVNVLGWLPPTTSSGSEPVIAVGAHYDHLGHGEGGNSLADASENGEIHNGADDNASGCAAVLATVAQLAGKERHRGLVVGFWGGEEIGLLGSAAFVDGLEELPVHIGAYVNFDMVGRLRDDKLTVQGVGSSEVWPGFLERANVVAGFDLVTSADPYLPTDSQSFYLEGIPTINFFTGSHEDYHRPSDDADKIDVDGVERIARMATLIIQKMDTAGELPAYAKVERSRAASGDRDTMRAFTGTIPDYTTEVDGLMLSGVVAGGPAEEAGLQKGDIIVEFAGQSIKNIYDYTYALDAVKVDVPVQVVILREGEQHQFTITPRARK